MKKKWLWLITGILAGLLLFGSGSYMVQYTSRNEYCESCHVHPHSTASWKQSVHYVTKSGIQTNCTDCHLPPHGQGYLAAKIRTGARDVWGKWTKDSAEFNWDEKGQLEYARKHVYESSCIACHKNLFPPELTKEGADAHLYYTNNRPKESDLHCINCHLNAGHFIEGYVHGGNTGFGTGTQANLIKFTNPSPVTHFANYTEQIPGSTISFNMVAVPGGIFNLGSPDSEPLRDTDEGPVKKVKVDSFFMAEIEVSWDEYLAFYAQTSGEGRSTDTEGLRSKKTAQTDAITGATPPYGQPDQGWGRGQRPAISISFHAAETYCKWLSSVTGKKYRLPTEAEWEYACRAGTKGPYFFDGDPSKFQKSGLRAKISKNDTAVINTYVVYAENSRSKTQEPGFVAANPFGLKNMLGNVAEFCSDWYQPDAYSQYKGEITVNPAGPASGTERVVRGGSYRDPAGMVRSASRDYTRTDAWLHTDPQLPKSIWWYSDCFFAGFRVVCEFNEATGKK
jgi:formylglycine-generating enzyme required for sulfatase activity/nitrate/TMAO reductase-like tetraheme cytochrome c subunit